MIRKPLLEVFYAFFDRPGLPFGCPRAAGRLSKEAQSPPRTPRELSLELHFEVFWRFFRELEPEEVQGTVPESFWLHLGATLVPFGIHFQELVADVLQYI